MDKNEQSIETEKIKAKFVKGSSQPSEIISKSNSGELFDRLLKERASHREIMLGYVVRLTFYSFYLLVGIVVVQGLVRIASITNGGDGNFTILDNYQLNIFAVSVFGQAIGVIVIIVKSLWDDENYLKKI